MSFDFTPGRIPSQAGRRILITGANSGIGYPTAVELARHGATVLLACRDEVRGRAALARLKVDAQGPASAADRAELVLLDLASLASVARVAEAELRRAEPLDCLINNAGVFAPPRRKLTADGFELQFGTNVLGHFALLCRLMPALRRAPAARVVTVASIAHKRGRLDFADLQSERGYNGQRAYYQSKLADLMLAFELDRRLRGLGSSVESIAAHPGVARTNLFKVGSGKGLAAVAERAIQGILGVAFNSEAAGALPTLYAAASPTAKAGGYYGPQGWHEMRGGDVGDAEVAPHARDEAAQRRLWEVCAELTGVDLNS